MNIDYCLAPDTKVALINGKCDTIQSICERLANGENLYTYSINPQTEDIVVSRILAGRKTRENEPTLKIRLDNGETITCSHNHKFMLRHGEYIEAQNLVVGDSLMGFHSEERTSYYGVTNHKIVSIKSGDPMDLYDIQVENFENFALSAGIFVHNCALEMRIAAIISSDKKMTQAFLSGADIHKANASYIWRIPIEEVTKDLRTKAKSF